MHGEAAAGHDGALARNPLVLIDVGYAFETGLAWRAFAAGSSCEEQRF